MMLFSCFCCSLQLRLLLVKAASPSPLQLLSMISKILLLLLLLLFSGFYLCSGANNFFPFLIPTLEIRIFYVIPRNRGSGIMYRKDVLLWVAEEKKRLKLSVLKQPS
jgi:hypothetical protein